MSLLLVVFGPLAVFLYVILLMAVVDTAHTASQDGDRRIGMFLGLIAVWMVAGPLVAAACWFAR